MGHRAKSHSGISKHVEIEMCRALESQQGHQSISTHYSTENVCTGNSSLSKFLPVMLIVCQAVQNSKLSNTSTTMTKQPICLCEVLSVHESMVLLFSPLSRFSLIINPALHAATDTKYFQLRLSFLQVCMWSGSPQEAQRTGAWGTAAAKRACLPLLPLVICLFVMPLYYKELSDKLCRSLFSATPRVHRDKTYFT